MTNQKTEQKRRTRRRKPPADPVQQETPEAFFKKVQTEVAALINDSDVLLNVPIWGWPTNGKTCALLTAIQYCVPELHGLGLARVKDRDEMADLEAAQPGYSGLGLSSLAEATSARLADLNQQFFVDLTWPPGTDTAMHYLLEARTTSGRLGFVLHPDITGGSYEKLDQIAKNALAHAHAVLLLVDPDDYQADSPQGKEYRDDVLTVIQRCAREEVPVCVLITKDDQHQEDPTMADEAQANLTALLKQQIDGFQSEILRVSVIGDIEGDWSEAPPSVGNRKPDRLIHGWVWALHQALVYPRARARERVPRTNLKDSIAKQPRLPARTIPEIRLVRDQTGSAGSVLCAASAGDGGRFLVLDSEAAEVTELLIDPESDEARIENTFAIEDWDEPEDVRAFATAGAVFLGGEGSGEIWHATKGQSLTKTPLPYPMAAWTPIADRVLVGIDGSGTLHTLTFSAGKWSNKDYRPDFVAPGHLAFGVVRRQSLIVAHNGTTTSAIAVNARGKLGALSKVSIPVQFDTSDAVINDAGFVAARRADNTVVAGIQKEHILGTTPPSPPIAFSIAGETGDVAWVSNEQRLHAAVISAGTLKSTDSANSPVMDELPDGMCWSSDGSVLLLTFPSGRWAWARRFGF